MISFQQKIRSIENALTGSVYSLQAMDSLQAEERHIQKVTAICNEPEIYRWLYQSMLKGEPYSSDSAVGWMTWGTEGWKEGTHFTFIVLDAGGEIAAACDIKSSDADRAEIGYWASAQHRGVMTNAVTAMLELAEQSGFRGFYAEVLPENERSQAVLERAGFLSSEDDPKISGHLVYCRNKGA